MVHWVWRADDVTAKCRTGARGNRVRRYVVVRRHRQICRHVRRRASAVTRASSAPVGKGVPSVRRLRAAGARAVVHRIRRAGHRSARDWVRLLEDAVRVHAVVRRHRLGGGNVGDRAGSGTRAGAAPTGEGVASVGGLRAAGVRTVGDGIGRASDAAAGHRTDAPSDDVGTYAEARGQCACRRNRGGRVGVANQ